MLNLRIMGRASGKTHRVIQYMREHEDCILIISSREHLHHYPIELRDRIYTAYDFLYHPEKFHGKPRKAVLDEGLHYPKFIIAQLYFELGRQGWSVESYGTDDTYYRNVEPSERGWIERRRQDITSPQAELLEALGFVSRSKTLSTDEKIAIARKVAEDKDSEPGLDRTTTADASEDAGGSDEVVRADGE